MKTTACSCCKNRLAVARGLCSACHRRWRHRGTTEYLRAKNGNGNITKKGHKRIHKNKKRVYEHRWVWEQVFGPLLIGWVVHHIDNNPIGPHLVAMPHEDHSAIHGRAPKKRRVRSGKNKEAAPRRRYSRTWED